MSKRSELNIAKKQDLAQLKANLGLTVQRLSTENKNTEARLKSLSNDHKAAVKKTDAAERKNRRLRGDLQSQMTKMVAEQDQVNRMVTSMQAQLKDTIDKLSGETLTRVQIQNKIQLEEELTSQKNLYDEQQRSFINLREEIEHQVLIQVYKEVEGEFESRLTTKVKKMREEHERKQRFIRKELEDQYQSVIEGLKEEMSTRTSYENQLKQQLQQMTQQVSLLKWGLQLAHDEIGNLRDQVAYLSSGFHYGSSAEGSQTSCTIM